MPRTILMAAFVLAPFPVHATAVEPRLSNVIVIVADQLRYQSVGYAGGHHDIKNAYTPPGPYRMGLDDSLGQL